MNLRAGAPVDLTDLITPGADGIRPRIFADERIYRLELERIFAKCWLFLGHESQIRNKGDYITTWMAEDPILLCRSNENRICAFLNSCPHRGMKVCRTEAGNASAFRCAYHGWTFNTQGRLTGVPEVKECYGPDFDKSKHGLLPVSRVESYRGLIFGTWDASAPSLADYLGEGYRFYLDVMLGRALGELEVLGSVQRYRLAANWKVPAENFSGDVHHVIFTHGASVQIGLAPPIEYHGTYTASFDRGHGMTDIPEFGVRYQADKALGRALGPEVEEYMDALHAKMRAEMTPVQADLFSVGWGTVFPNFSWLDVLTTFPTTFIGWHPRGPRATEVWEMVAIDSAAPQRLKDHVRERFAQVQSVAGLFGQDDSEVAEQIAEATGGFIAQERHKLDYSMGSHHKEELHVPGLPGRIGPHFTEQNLRNFYQQWRAMMSGTSIPPASEGGQP